jgi:hypothetical protein
MGREDRAISGAPRPGDPLWFGTQPERWFRGRSRRRRSRRCLSRHSRSAHRGAPSEDGRPGGRGGPASPMASARWPVRVRSSQNRRRSGRTTVLVSLRISTSCPDRYQLFKRCARRTSAIRPHSDAHDIALKTRASAILERRRYCSAVEQLFRKSPALCAVANPSGGPKQTGTVISYSFSRDDRLGSSLQPVFRPGRP